MSIEIPLKYKHLHPVKGLQKATQSEGVKKQRKKLTGPQAARQREITAANQMGLWIIDGKKKWLPAGQSEK